METTTTRDIKAIQMEYTQLCQQAGDMQYKVLCYQDQLAQMNNKIRELNHEANALKEQTNGQDTITTAGPDEATKD